MMDAQNTGKMSLRQQVSAMKRVLGYLLRDYKFSFFIVVVCILGSALATLRGTLFMQSLIDDYIVPLTQAQTPDFSKLAAALVAVALTYGIGILCAYGYNRITLRWHQHQQNPKGRFAPQLGHGAAGHTSVYRNRDGEYPLRPPGCHR